MDQCTSIKTPDSERREGTNGFSTDVSEQPFYGAIVVNENDRDEYRNLTDVTNPFITDSCFSWWHIDTMQVNRHDDDQIRNGDFNDVHVLSHRIKWDDAEFQKSDMRAFGIKYKIARNDRYVERRRKPYLTCHPFNVNDKRRTQWNAVVRCHCEANCKLKWRISFHKYRNNGFHCTELTTNTECNGTLVCTIIVRIFPNSNDELYLTKDRIVTYSSSQRFL